MRGLHNRNILWQLTKYKPNYFQHSSQWLFSHKFLKSLFYIFKKANKQ